MAGRWRRRLRGRLIDAGFAAGWAAGRRLPARPVAAAFRAGARWAAGRDTRGVRQLRANLRVATGGRLSEVELAALTTRAVASYARYWQEMFWLPRIDPQLVVAGTQVQGRDHVDLARDGGRGLVLALSHSGNWDAAAVWLVDYLGGPFLTVAERLSPESLFARFVAYREALGMRVVPLTGGPRPSATVLREWLDDGGAVCLVADRDLSAGGVPVSFFGRPARMPGGPALLAAQTGAALIPVSCQFSDTGWGLRFFPEVPLAAADRLRERVPAAMQGVADAFATGITERPEDWHMLARIWVDVPADPARVGSRAGRRTLVRR